jgi:hypothetical protein
MHHNQKAQPKTFSNIAWILYQHYEPFGCETFFNLE